MSHAVRRLLMAVIAACGLLYVMNWLTSVPVVLSGVAGYVCLGILPGIALVVALRPGGIRLGGQAAMVGLGPVVAGLLLALLMISGLSLEYATRFSCVGFAAAALVSTALCARAAPTISPQGSSDRASRRPTWLIAAAALALLAVFPLLGEAYRMRSDAWFHAAVVSEISDFGLPPTDPYFSGMTLQYMWLYHVYVAALSAATGVGASWAMSFVNLQALVCLVLATSAVAGSLKPNKPGSALSPVFMLLGLNCLFWAFLPLKLARAAHGQIRGWEEIARLFSLSPFTAEKAGAFVSVWKSRPFLLDKFIVATAFSLGICLSVLFFLFAYRYIASGKAYNALFASCAMAGVVFYHTPAGLAASGTVGIALVALALSSSGPMRLRSISLILCMAGVSALAAPYVYTISSGKEAEQLLPIGVSAFKTSAVLISCAGAIVLGAPWAARFLSNREDPRYFYGLMVASALLVALCIVLPGPNVYDKPPYFAFLPLAPLAGWSLHAIYRRGSTRARRALISVLCAAAIVPNTVILYAAYVADPGPPQSRPNESSMYEWIGEATARDAVFLENDDRVGMVVLGPRRLIWGHDSYAYQWGYDRDEMSRRRELRDRVYSGRPLTAWDAEELAGFGEEVYLVARREDFEGADAGRLADSPYLVLEYSDPYADVYRVRPPSPR